ncbi:MAG: hypothetical protein HYU99_03325 [Deltaproteobacteria bacterium]|nr:hypothetical protein [Deltaproteobacteria bacterium]
MDTPYLPPLTAPSATEPWYLLEDDGIAMAPEEKERPTRKGAEYVRLKEEVKKLVRTGKWDGVEDNYQDILALNVPIDAEVHHWGALAARERGDSLAFYRREQLALQSNPIGSVKTEVEGDIAYIEREYGCVDITSPAGSSYSLVPSAMPIAPDQRKSIESADAQLKATGSFKGLLPVVEIDYRFVPIAEGAPSLSAEDQRTWTFQSIEKNGSENYQEVKLGKTNGRKEAAATAPPLTKAKQQIHGELGLMGGGRTTSPTYGPSYVMRGGDLSLFAGAFAETLLTRKLGLRAGGRLGYGVTTQQGTEDVPYALDNSYLQGSLRLHALFRTKPAVFGAGISLGHGANFDSPFGAPADQRIGVGSADVELKNLSIIQTPVLGASFLIEKKSPSDRSVFLELGVQHAVIGIEGEVAENPEWTSGAPFAVNSYQLGLGVTF